MIDRNSFSGGGRGERGSPGSVSRDLRYGIRSARRRPGFCVAIIAALALGIGTSTAVLNLVRSGSLHPEPVDSPAGLRIPPARVELISQTSDPARVPDSRLLGGALSSRSSRPATIAEQQREDLVVVLTSLGGAAAVLLLVTSSNLLLLLIARGADRRAEVATRSMLGAGRVRLIRQLLTEHAPLLLLGSVLGAALAGLLGAGVRASWPQGFTAWASGAVSPEVVVVTFGAPLVTVALCAVLPGLLLDEDALRSTAGDGARLTADVGEGRCAHRLSVLGVAVAVTLVVAAGLLFRSFAQTGESALVPFDPADTLTFVVRQPSASGATAEEVAAMGSPVGAAVAQVTGVRAVALSGEGAWLGLGAHGGVHSLTGSPGRPGFTGSARHAAFSPGALAAMRTPLLAGRDFRPDDAAGAPAVALVNRTFANRYFLDDPIGRRVQPGRISLDGTWFTVVGVFEDFRPTGIGNAAAPEPLIAFSTLQIPPPSFEIAARFAGDREAVLDAVERALATAAPDAFVDYTGSMEEKLDRFGEPLSWLGVLLGALAGVAALLAAYGLHGLISVQRPAPDAEIGIRIAIGAPPSAVVRSLVRDGLRVALQGSVLGSAGALCVGRLFQFTFAGVELVDFAVHLPVLGLTFAIAVLASYLPARTAARVDPAIALAHD